MPKSRRRILLVGPLPPPHGGMAVLMQNLTDGFGRMGYEIARIDTAGKSLHSVLEAYRSALAAWPSVDAVHIIAASGGSLVAKVLPILLLFALRQTPTILNFVGGTAVNAAKQWSSIKKLPFRLATRVVVPTESFHRALSAAGLGRGFSVIPHCVNVERFWSAEVEPDRPPLLLAAKQFVTYSGYEYLIQMYRLVLKHVPHARFVIAGDGALLSQMKAVAHRQGLSGITFLGNVANDEMPALYSQASVFVHGARYESFGIALIEAMASGTPPVAFAVGGIPDLIADGETGYLIPYGDVECFAARVVELLTGPARWRQMSLRCRQASQRYRWDRLQGQWRELYDQLLEP